MNKGKIKWFNNQKGYGFISNEAGNDVFVHYSGINKDSLRYIEEDAIVEFEVINSAKGSQATNVSVLNNEDIDNNQHDRMKKITNKIIARASLSTARSGAGLVSFWGWYQPKVPSRIAK